MFYKNSKDVKSRTPHRRDVFQSALHEVKRDYYSECFLLNPHELTKIVLQSSTKFFVVKWNHLASELKQKSFSFYPRVTYNTGETQGFPYFSLFRHCETVFPKKIPQSVPLQLFDALRQIGCFKTPKVHPF